MSAKLASRPAYQRPKYTRHARGVEQRNGMKIGVSSTAPGDKNFFEIGQKILLHTGASKNVSTLELAMNNYC